MASGTPERTPIVFISYSWDTEEHKEWVSQLAKCLVRDGANVLLDEWEPGGANLDQFMQGGIELSDRVLCICTDNYVERAEEKVGGAGYEGSIITAQLMKNAGTTKFIPIVRNVTSKEKKTPIFLETKKYIDLSDSGDFETGYRNLLRDIFGVSRKPSRGQNPFSEKTQNEGNSEQAPILEPDISSIYREAFSLLRNRDALGWRQLLKRGRPAIQRELGAWDDKYQKESLSDVTMCRMALDDAVQRVAPVIVAHLAAVESKDSEWKDQKHLVNDLVNAPNWQYSGYATRVGIPEALAFVYQALHGAVCLHTGQLDIALNLANEKLKSPRTGKYDPLWTIQSLMGWPEFLGGDCRQACEFIVGAAERWSWLEDLFGNSYEYRTCLSAYYQALNIQECAATIAGGISPENLENQAMEFRVPLCLLERPPRENEQGFELLRRCGSQIEQLWQNFGIERETMKSAWPHWLEACRKWRLNVYGSSYSPQMPHRLLFDAV